MQLPNFNPDMFLEFPLLPVANWLIRRLAEFGVKRGNRKPKHQSRFEKRCRTINKAQLFTGTAYIAVFAQLYGLLLEAEDQLKGG